MLSEPQMAWTRTLLHFAALSALWTVLGALGYLHHVQTAGPSSARGIGFVDWLICYWTWIPLSLLIVRLEAHVPEWAPTWRRAVLFMGIASVAFSWTAYQITRWVDVLARTEQTWRADRGFTWTIPADEFSIEEFMFWGVVAGVYAARKLRELRTRERAAARFALEKAYLEATVRKAELELLRTRLNPHFLFNALQNISVLTQQRPQLASRMLIRLGDLLRTAVKNDFQSEVTLDTELAATQAYLDIEQMRFQDRLGVEWQIDPAARDALVPSLLLQPLVENAVIHGLAKSGKTGRIFIAASARQGRLIMQVSDNGDGLPAGIDGGLKPGFGLSSTRERLAHIYPGNHEIAMKQRDEGGTEVRIDIPFRTEELLASDTHSAPAHSRR
jgi:two-component system LytT family sensor kinase